jgi:glycosyl transferase family 87
VFRAFPFALIAAFLITVLGAGLHKNRLTIEILATGRSQSAAKAAVVWLASPQIGELTEKGMRVEKSIGWVNKNGIFLSNKKHPAVLRLRGVFQRDDRLQFFTTEYSGEMLAEINGRQIPMDLFAAKPGLAALRLKDYTISGPFRPDTTLLSYAVTLLKNFLVIMFCIALYFRNDRHIRRTANHYRLNIPSLVLILTFISMVLITIFLLFQKSMSAADLFWRQVNLSMIGIDFKVPYHAAQQLLSGEKIYVPSHGQYPNYDYIPQSLIFVLPFTIFHPNTAYYVFSAIAFLTITFCFFLVGRASETYRPSSYLPLFIFTIVFSEAGILLYQRGNLEALAAIFTYIAFLMWLKKKEKYCSVFIALASCIKPMYLPLFLVSLFMRRRLHFLGALIAVHGLALVMVSAISHNAWLILDYSRNLEGYLDFVKTWDWNINISILSSLSRLIRQEAFMSFGASLLMLSASTLLCLWIYRKAVRNGVEQARILTGAGYFILLAYVTVEWQFVSLLYNSLPLLLALPLADRLYLSAQSWWARGLLVAQGVVIGLIFSVAEPPHSPLEYKASFVLIGLLIWGLLLGTGTIRRQAVATEQTI